MKVGLSARGCNTHLLEGPPWITRDADHVVLDLSGAEPPHGRSESVEVTFDAAEWEIIKARIEAAFADRDPNLSEFYSPKADPTSV